MLKILKSKSGVSLIEILVAAMMFSILTFAVVMVINPLMMAQVRANSLAEKNTILDSVGNLLTTELSGATEILEFGVDELEFSTAQGDVIFTISSGHLLRNGALVFPEYFYRGKTLSFVVEENASGYGYFYLVIVTVYPNEISRSYAVRPMILG